MCDGGPAPPESALKNMRGLRPSWGVAPDYIKEFPEGRSPFRTSSGKAATHRLRGLNFTGEDAAWTAGQTSARHYLEPEPRLEFHDASGKPALRTSEFRVCDN